MVIKSWNRAWVPQAWRVGLQTVLGCPRCSSGRLSLYHTKKNGPSMCMGPGPPNPSLLGKGIAPPLQPDHGAHVYSLSEILCPSQ